MAEVPIPRGGGLAELRGRSGWGPPIRQRGVRVGSSFDPEGGQGQVKFHRDRRGSC